MAVTATTETFKNLLSTRSRRARDYQEFLVCGHKTRNERKLLSSIMSSPSDLRRVYTAGRYRRHAAHIQYVQIPGGFFQKLHATTERHDPRPRAGTRRRHDYSQCDRVSLTQRARAHRQPRRRTMISSITRAREIRPRSSATRRSCSTTWIAIRRPRGAD